MVVMWMINGASLVSSVVFCVYGESLFYMLIFVVILITTSIIYVSIIRGMTGVNSPFARLTYLPKEPRPDYPLVPLRKTK